MLRRFSINFALLSMLLDGLAVFAALRLAVFFRPALNELDWVETMPMQVALPFALNFLFPLIWILVYSVLSIYDGRKYLRAVDEFAALTLAVFFSAISSAGILYLSYREVSRALFVAFILLAYLICLVWRILARLYFRAQKLPPASQRRVLVVGAGALGQKVAAQMMDILSPALVFAGFLDEAEIPAEVAAQPRLGSIDRARAIVAEQNITDVVIALPHSAYHQMGDIVQQLEDVPVRVWVALGFFDLALYKTAIEDFAGIPMLDLRASAIDDYERTVKRAFDIFFGTLALLCFLPFMAVAALLIFLQDGLPVIFKQQRVGENGRLFEMLKFRTMVRNAEQLQAAVEQRDAQGNLLHKSKDDPRVTRVGRFLRRYSIDELPQFINVIRGDMSLVGPRPELPYLVEKYQPWQRKRFAVPPGITGWWQVNGRSDKPMHLNTEDDLYYLANYSLWLDILILMRTVWTVLIGKGAY